MGSYVYPAAAVSRSSIPVETRLGLSAGQCGDSVPVQCSCIYCYVYIKELGTTMALYWEVGEES